MTDPNGTQEPEGAPRRFKEIQLTPRLQVAVTVAVAILLVVSVMVNVNSQECMGWFCSLWLLGAFGVLLVSTLRLFASRRLLRHVQEPEAAPTGTETDRAATEPVPPARGLPGERKRGPPPPPFAMRVYDSTTAPALTPSAAERVARANRDAEQSLRIWKWGLGFLVAGNVLVGLLDALLGDTAELFPMAFLWFVLLLATAALGLLKGQGVTWWAGYRIWQVANGLWLCGTALVALLSLCADGSFTWPPEDGGLAVGAGLPVLVAVALPVTHLLLVHYLGRKLGRSVMARPPIRLLYLWVFAPPAGRNLMASTLSPAWYVTGSVQFLRGSYLMADLGWLPSIVRGRGDRYVTETPEELAAAVRSFQRAPNWTGLYALNSLLCSDSVWQLALDTLLADTDVALMNLCGFSRERRGCAFELDRLVDRLATRRWLLVIDESTDLEYLEEVLRASWDAMVPGSPNRDPDVGPVQVFRLAPPEKQEVDATVLLKALTAVPTVYGPPQAEASRLFEILCAGALSS